MSLPVDFDTATARHGFPMLVAGQAQKEFFVNEALARIDALLHPAFETVANTPPAVPAAGECWLVGPAPLGAWEGQADALAFWDGVQWSFCAPADGMQMFDRAEGQWILFRSGWRRVTRPQPPLPGVRRSTSKHERRSERLSMQLQHCRLFATNDGNRRRLVSFGCHGKGSRLWNPFSSRRKSGILATGPADCFLATLWVES